MHIRKNVTKFLCKSIDGKNNKEEIAKNISDIQESNIATFKQFLWYWKLHQLSWLLIEKVGYVVKEVAQNIKIPVSFYSNISNISTKEAEFSWDKNQNCHMFIKVQHFATSIIL